MPSYLLLIAEPRGQRQARNEAEGRAAYDEMLAYADALKARGVLRAVASLQSDDQGVRVQRRQGEKRLLDGPFSEAKEMIGGFFLIDVAGREQALELAAECPAAQWATVEVRETGPCWL
ncbi:YciI family protein [Aquabacterium sp. J223]|uniref:YciI family protein n=1 Tax=Aquabacterium sp. J223 TaxID=2898431 RepID=UPI0021AE27A7|nr:YciI family protein [Aquabacterium sp. J223]UUX94327.1 YciI family protein [Aquabacterium sp. J223]